MDIENDNKGSEKDIISILAEWEYDPDSNVRKIVGEDGIPKIQIRVD